MLGLSPSYRYYLFHGSVDMRKGVFSLSELVRSQLRSSPTDPSNVYIFMAKSRKVVKILRYERGFFVLYEKRPIHGKFRKPVLDASGGKYQISWSDMVMLTESLETRSMRILRVVNGN